MSLSDLLTTSLFLTFSARARGISLSRSEFDESATFPQEEIANARVLITEFVSFLEKKHFSASTAPEKIIAELGKKFGISDPVCQAVANFIQQENLLQANVLLLGFVLALQADGCSHSTIKNYRSDIRQFFTFANESALNKIIRKPKLQAFVKDQLAKGLAVTSVRRKLVSITQFGIWLELQNVVPVQSLRWLENFGVQYEKDIAATAPAALVENTNNTHRNQSIVLNNPSKKINWRSFVSNQPSSPPSPLGSSSSKTQKSLSPLKAQEWRYQLKEGLYKLHALLQSRTRAHLVPYLNQLLGMLNHSQDSRKTLKLIQLYSKLTAESRRYILPYVNLLLSLILFSGMAYFGYQQLFAQVEQPLAFPTALTRPNRTLSFQGRLTDTAQNPIISASDLRFKLYDSGPSIVGGTLLWDSTVCAVTPDQDGIFAVGLGADCGAEIGSDVFSENANVWLQVEVEGETLEPRQSIKSVAYALNAETLQGYPASASAVENTVVIMDNNGEIVLGNANPVLRATGDSFAIEAETLTLRTASGSNGDITLAPDGTGKIKLLSDVDMDGYLAAPGATLSATYAGGTALVLKAGPSATGNIMEWQNSAGTPLGVIDESGNVGIGTTSPTNLLYVRGSGSNDGAITISSSATDANAWLNLGGRSSGTTNTASLYADYAGGLNMSSASNTNIYFNPGGAEKMRLTPGGNLGLSSTSPSQKLDVVGAIRLGAAGAGNVLNTSASAAPTGNLFWGDRTICDSTGSCGGGFSNYWRLNLGTISPVNDTLDLLVGANATTSAKFAVLNVNSGTPIASVSSGLSGTSMYMTADGTLATQNRQSLTIGNSSTYNTTGNVLINPNGTGNVGIGTTIPAAKLDVSGNIFLSPLSANNTLFLTAQEIIYANSDGGVINLEARNSIAVGGNYGFPGMTVGYSTASPRAMLDLKVSNNAVTTNRYGGYFENLATNTTTDAISKYGLYINSTGTFTGSTGTATNNYGLYVNTPTGADNNYAAIFAGGNVGIGTTGPTSRLSVHSAASATSAIKITDDTYYTLDIGYGASGLAHIMGRTGTSLGLGTNGSEKVRINSDGNVGIGSTSPIGLLNVNGAATGKALTILNQTGNQDIFTASVSGTPKFVISNSGNVGIGTTAPSRLLEVGSGTVSSVFGSLVQILATDTNNAGIGAATNNAGVFMRKVDGQTAPAIYGYNYATSSGLDLSINQFGGNVGIGSTSPSQKLDVVGAIRLGAAGAGNVLNTSASAAPTGNLFWGDRTVCDSTGSCTGASFSNYWRLNLGTISPVNDTLDFLVGANATSSAKFAVLNVNNGTPVASVSSGLSGNSMYMTADGTLATTRRQSLTIGNSSTYNTTGNVFINPNGTGNVGIGTTSAASRLEVFSTGLNTDVQRWLATDGSRLGRFTETSGGHGWFEVDNSSGTAVALFRADGGASYISSGNFGIGSTAPTALLDIAGSASTSGTLAFRGTTDPKIDILNGENFGIRTSPGGDAGLSEKLTVLNNGNVGIGTTGPGYKLDIAAGGIRLVGGGAGASTNEIAFTSDRGHFRTLSGGTGKGDFWFTTWDGSASHDALVIKEGGSVGIGTTSPVQSKLEIWGVRETSYNRGILGVIDTTSMAAGVGGSVGFFGKYTSGGSIADAASIWASKDNATTGEYGFSLNLGTRTNGVNNITADLTIASNGNVGIGSTSPIGLLNVNGAATGKALAILNQTGNQDIFTASVSGVPKFVISNSGNVGVGTISPAAKLDVQAGSDVSILYAGNSNGVLRLYNDTVFHLARVSGTATSFQISQGWTGVGIMGTSFYSTAIDSPDTNYFRGGFGTAAAPYFSFYNDSDTGVFHSGTNALGFSTAGTETMTINTGNVGISSTAPSQKLDVVGAIRLGTAGAYNVLNTSAAGAAPSGYLYWGDRTVCDSTGSCGGGFSNYWRLNLGTISPVNDTLDLLIGSNATASAKFAVLNVNSGTPVASVSSGLSGTAMYMTADGTLATQNRMNLTIGNSATYNTTGNVLINPNGTGNVGIGTTAPGQKLTIAGAQFAPVYLGIEGQATAINTETNGILFSNQYPSPQQLAKITVGTESELYYGYLAFSTVRSGFANTLDERMRITQNGNVGIGTTAPNVKLEIAGDVRLTGNQYSIYSGATYRASLYDNGTYTGIFGDGDGSNPAIAIETGNVGIGSTSPIGLLNVNGAATGKALAILNQTGNQDIFTASVSGTPKFVISNSGNVGIGTTEPGYKLTVDSGYIGLSDGYGVSWGNSTIYGYQNSLIGFQTAGSEKMRLSATGGLSLGNSYVGTDAGAGNMIISGNVGIGTTGPGKILDVVTTSATDGIRLVRGGVSQFYAQADGVVQWGPTTAQGFLSWDTGKTRIMSGSGVGLSLETNASSTSRMFITTAGNVGIGTTVPLSALDVTGDIYLTSGLSTFRTAVSDGTIEATKFCTGDGETNCTTDFSALAAGSSIWTNTLNVIHPQGALASITDLVIGGNSTASADFRVTGLGNGSTDLAGYTYGRRFIDVDSTGYYVEPGNTTTAGLFAGNVGIGTTGPSSMFQVGSAAGGNFRASSGGEFGHYYQAESVARVGLGRDMITSGGYTAFSMDGSAYATQGSAVSIPAARTLGFYTSNATALTERMRIDSTGNVGIGTTAPGRTLEVYGTAAGAEYIGQRIYNAGSGAGTTALLEFIAYDTAGSRVRIGGSRVSGATNESAFILQTTDSSNTLAERLRVIGNGNVGIGSTAPGDKLHVLDSVDGTGVDVTSLFERRDPNTPIDGFGGAIGLQLGRGDLGVATESARLAAIMTSVANRNADLALYSLNAGTLTEGMRLQSSGNVGIGTTGPGYKLDVVGTNPDLRLYNTAGGGHDTALWLTGNEGAATERGFGIRYYDYASNYQSMISRSAHFVLGADGNAIAFGKATGTNRIGEDNAFTNWMTLTGGNWVYYPHRPPRHRWLCLHIWYSRLPWYH